jgi:hypothetical protein
MLTGLTASLLPWVFYLLQDPGSFLAQFGNQLSGKASTHPLALMGWIHGVVESLVQYGLPLGFLAGLLWGAGLVGLCFAAQGRKNLWALPVCQILLLPVLGIGEIWYPLYVLPLAALGVTHLARAPELKAHVRLIDRLLAVILLAGFVYGNLSCLARVPAERDGGVADYGAWCAQVSALIPPGSKVLLSVIPDPYFGLLGRTDLQLREFLPERNPIDPKKYIHYMSGADFIVVGAPWSPSSAVARFAASQGQIVGTVAAPRGGDNGAQIYKIPKEDAFPSSHE